MSDIVIAITAPGNADGVRAVIEKWTTAGFLRPFLWLQDGDTERLRAEWSDGSGEIPLLEAVAAQPYGQIRLVCLLLAPAGGSPLTDELPDRSQAVREAIARRLAADQQLTVVGLVAPANGRAEVPDSVLATQWDVNAVVVDEDRLDPRHASRDITTAADLEAHAALALACAGGLWTGMVTTPFDLDGNGAGDQEPRVTLMRSYARAARHHGLHDEITRKVVTLKENPHWSADMAEAEPVDDAEHAVDRAAVEFLNGPGIRLRRTPHVPKPRRLFRMTPRQALRLLWLFIRGRVGEIQDELQVRAADAVRDQVEALTQRVTFGDGTDVVVRFDGRPLPTDVTGDPETADLAQALVDAVRRPSGRRTFPDEWHDLRGLAFGLVDAGDLPEGCTTPASGVHRQVLPPEAVSPALADFVEPTTDWLATEPDSLLSRIGRRVASDTADARAAFLDALSRVKKGVPKLEAFVDRRLWYAWLLCGLLAVVGLGVTVALHATNVLTIRNSLLVGGAVVLCFLLASAVIGFLHLRKQFQAAHRSNLAWAAYENARAAAEHEAEELVRLSAAVGEFSDWAAVIGWIVHQGPVSDDQLPPDPVDLATMTRPWAFGVAEAVVDDQRLGHLAARVGRRCLRPGWLSALYTRTSSQVMTQVAFDRGLGPEAPDPVPEVDSTARRRLCAELVDGLALRSFTAEIQAVTVDQTAGMALSDLFSGVQPPAASSIPIADFLDAVGGGGESSFNRRLWTAESGFPDVPVVPVTWTSALADPRADEGGPVWLCPDEKTITALAVRVEVSAPVRWSELAVFRQEKADVEVEPFDPDGGIG
ncbi:hypothetical protein [Kutzneria sp. CA-103260]|uniref:hypothetical protein n=1 Tax=Kutzneria sp. CA-103260 TaxID=2802641 RepID=UPI001BA6A303|nr:hypothetical protein [Kutzneria sp. CA-103260]QUQ63862.1 hypothetical protein JJ691_15790 [Kutzneria sp. CA-103260]